MFALFLEIENDDDDVVNQDEIDRQLREAYDKKAQEKSRGEISRSQAQEMVDWFFAHQKFLLAKTTKQIEIVMFRVAGENTWNYQLELARMVHRKLVRNNQLWYLNIVVRH